MRFTITAAALAFAASAFAQTAGFDALTTPATDEDVPAGETYTILWQPGSVTGTVTLSLLGGATPATLDILSTIAASIDNTLGSYDWAVDSSLGDLATYGIKITLDSNTTTFQYSNPFHIVGSSDDSSSSTTVVASSTVSTDGGYSTSAVDSYSTSAASTYVETSTSSAATEYPVTSTSTFATATPTGNSTVPTTSAYATTTLVSSTTAKGSSTSSAATTSSTIVSTNGAPRAAAGSLALIGGLVAAIFAL